MSRHGLLYLIGTGVQGLALLFALPFVTAALSKTEYAVVGVALVVMTTIVNSLAAGIPQLVLRDYGHGEAGRRDAHVSVGLMVTGGIVFAVVGAAVVGLLVATGVIDDAAALLSIIIGTGAILCTTAAQAVFRASGRPIAFALLAIAMSLGPILAGLAAVRLRATGGAYLAAYTGALAALAVVSSFLAKPTWPWVDRVRARVTLPPALTLIPQGMAMSLLQSGDVMLAQTFVHAGAATYQPALALGNITFTIALALFNAWGPAIYRQRPEGRWEWAGRTAVLLAAVLAAMAAVIALAAQWIVPLFVAAHLDREAIAALVGIVVWTAVPQVVVMGCNLVLIEHGRTKTMANVTVLMAVSFVLVGGLATAGLGLRALAIVRLVAQLALLAFVWAAARRLEPTFRPANLPALVVLCAMIAGVAVFAVATSPVTSIASVVLAVVAGLAALAQLARLRGPGRGVASGLAPAPHGDD